MNDPTPLETSTTLELWQEMCKRHTACVLIYEKQAPTTNDKELICNNVWHYCSIPVAVGLIEFGRHYIQRQLEEYTCND